MPKQTLYVRGMHCSACEMLIEEKATQLDGVKKAEVSREKNELTLTYDNKKPDLSDVKKLFKETDYSFSLTPFASNHSLKNSLVVPSIIALLFIIIFFSLSKLGIRFVGRISAESSLLAFLFFGLLAGVSSCAALVGGLVLSMSKQWLDLYGKKESFWEKSKPHFLFNLGRIVAFGFLGFILGWLGEKIKFSPIFTYLMIILVSALMLVLALQMLGVKSFQRFRLTLPKSLTKKVAGKNEVANKYTPFLFGFLTLLLPCGFTLAAEGAAVLSQNSLKGLLIMVFFVLGTTIPLLLIGLFSTKLMLEEKIADKFLKTAGLIIIFFVLYNIYFQFGFNNLLTSNNQLPALNYSQEAQPSISTKIIKASYTNKDDIIPSDFTVKVGQPVRMEINVLESASGCMSTIMIPRLWDKALSLRRGQTLIMEFTPQIAGDYQITCAMGVPRGTIKVTN